MPTFNPSSAETLLFIGDSITDVERRDDTDGHLGHGYVRLVAQSIMGTHPQSTVINRGNSGDRIVDLEARWNEDVLVVAPSFLTVSVGVNDARYGYDGGPILSTPNFEAIYRKVLTTARDTHRPTMALIEPFVLPVTEEQLDWVEDLDAKREVVSRLAVEFGAFFIALQDRMTASAAQHGKAAVAADGVHPTAFGHGIMAEAWLKDTGFTNTRG